MKFDSLKVGQKFIFNAAEKSGWNKALNGAILIIKSIDTDKVFFLKIKPSETEKDYEKNWATEGNLFYLWRSTIDTDDNTQYPCPIERLGPITYTYKDLMSKIK